MDIRIKTTDYHITPDVREYLDARIATISRLLDESTSQARFEIELGKNAGHPQQGNIWRAELVIHHDGDRMVAIATGESINAAIDIAKDEMLQQVRKSKGRDATLMRRMGARLKRWARRGDMRSY